MRSEGGQQDPLFISNYATIIMDALKRVPGVGDAVMFGARDYAMRVWFHTDRLALNLTPTDVVNANQAAEPRGPQGRVGAQPISDDTSYQLNIRTTGRLVDAEEFGAILVRANSTARCCACATWRGSSSAPGTRDVETRAQRAVDAILIQIYLSPGANAVGVADAVARTMTGLAARFRGPRLRGHLRHHSLRQAGPSMR